MTKIERINNNNLSIYLHLADAYEAEFSYLTGNLPDENGVFAPDTLPDESHLGFILYEDDVPSGFCIAEVANEPYDVSEFYIVPVKRKQGCGYTLAEFVFKSFPGKWQVRQIEGADSARDFWRSVITKLTNGLYSEQNVLDPSWGRVTRQNFLIK